MKIISWNVNGFFGNLEDGRFSFIERLRPDVALFQNIRPGEEKVPEVLKNLNYKTITNISQSNAKNASTAVSAKTKDKNFDLLRTVDEKREGRVVQIEFGGITIVNVSAEVGKVHTSSQKDKIEFYKRLLEHLRFLIGEGRSVVLGGDFEISASELDLLNPSVNGRCSGFLAEEVEIIESLADLGLVDVFAHFNPDRERSFTFWPDRLDARRKNKGWRFDYFFVSEDLLSRVVSCEHLTDIAGSTHCPILIDIKL